MAIQSNIKLVKTVENLIFYPRLGGFYIRTKQARVRQTKATQKAESYFGKANRAEKVIRNTFHSIIPNTRDKQMMRQFTNVIYQLLNTGIFQTKQTIDQLPVITGFEYNRESLLTERLRVPVQAIRTTGGKITLHVPAFNTTATITAPARTRNVVCTIMAAACSIEGAIITGSYRTQLVIPYTNEPIPAKNIPLDITTGDGCLTIVAVALQYYTGTIAQENLINSMRWLPTRIIDAMYN